MASMVVAFKGFLMAPPIKNTFLHYGAEDEEDIIEHPTLLRARTSPIASRGTKGAWPAYAERGCDREPIPKVRFQDEDDVCSACSPQSRLVRQVTFDAFDADTLSEREVDDDVEEGGDVTMHLTLTRSLTYDSFRSWTPSEGVDDIGDVDELVRAVTYDPFEAPLTDERQKEECETPGSVVKERPDVVDDALLRALTYDPFEAPWESEHRSDMTPTVSRETASPTGPLLSLDAALGLGSPLEAVVAEVRDFAPRVSGRCDCQEEQREEEQREEPIQWTTLMLRNLPSNYKRQDMIELLDDQGFAGKYDFLYFPIDFRTHAAVGYAFVNLLSTGDAERMREKFEGFCDWSIPTFKVCTVSWGQSQNQGLAANIERYRCSPLLHASVPDDYRPMLFKDGVRIAFPAPTRRLKPPRKGTQRTLLASKSW